MADKTNRVAESPHFVRVEAHSEGHTVKADTPLGLDFVANKPNYFLGIGGQIHDNSRFAHTAVA